MPRTRHLLPLLLLGTLVILCDSRAETVRRRVLSVNGAVFQEYQLVPGSHPQDITAGPDGNLWFTDYQREVVARLTPQGVISEFAVPLTRPFGITRGPDGNIWFTQWRVDMVSRVSPTTPISGYATFNVTARSNPRDITMGPDGNLWFTSEGLGVGRITTSGVVTEFRAAIGSGGPQDITIGSDGNLWYAANRSVCRVSLAGVFTCFPVPALPDNTAGVFGIAAGHDGALWFTQAWNNKIGRVTTSGEMTHFSIPTPESAPKAMATAADGHVWFASPHKGYLGRVSPSGEIREFFLPDRSSQVSSLASGSDNNLWYTDAYLGRIGCLILSTTPVELQRFSAE